MCKNWHSYRHFPLSANDYSSNMVEAEKLQVEFQFPIKYNKTLIKPIHQTAHSLASK